MYQPEDDLNPKSPQNLDADKNIEDMDANLSAKNVATRKKQLEKIFVKLIAVGLSLGAILGVGTYYLLNKLGLTKKPYQIEQEKLQQQQDDAYEPIKYFPNIPKNNRRSSVK